MHATRPSDRRRACDCLRCPTPRAPLLTQAALDALRRLPHLKCLYLRGNPLVSAARPYRKAVLAALPSLTYLDDRPVFEAERRCADAW